LATGVVLLASIAMALAQTSPQGGAGQSQGPGAAPGAGASPSGGPRGQEGGQVQDRGAQEGKEKGRAQQGQEKGKAQGAKSKDGTAPDQEKGRDPQGAQQGQEKGKAQKGAKDKDGAAQRGQREQTDEGRGDRQQGERESGQRDQQKGERGQAGQAGGAATMTTQQRTRIRQTVITKGPRVTNVDFSVSVGTVVPRSVKLVVVPSVLVEIYPQYRGRKYFVYEEQIIIVDDDFKIVAVITV
jgi:Protein of unknown function (DUF1236)